MTTTSLHPQGVPVPQDHLSLAEQLALVTVLAQTLDALGARLLEQQPELLAVLMDGTPTLARLEHLGFIKQFGPGEQGGSIVIPSAEAFTLGFRLFAEDMVAMTGGSAL